MLTRGNARAPITLAFTDRASRRWYRITINPRTFRLSRTRMIGQRHFMTQRYAMPDGGATIQPPRTR